MSKAPKCRFCGKAEWNHLCNSRAEQEPPTVDTPAKLEYGVTVNTQRVTENELVTVNRRGRPNSGNALTPAEKQRAYRERHR